MNFVINNEDFVFTIEFQQEGGQNVLTSFTATKDEVEYNCSIQLDAVGSLTESMFCCTPLGCTSGGCQS